MGLLRVMFCTDPLGRMIIYYIESYIYHKQYCLCAVTGRSGSATQSFLLSRFFLISSDIRMRVFSSLRRTEKPIHVSNHPNHPSQTDSKTYSSSYASKDSSHP